MANTKYGGTPEGAYPVSSRDPPGELLPSKTSSHDPPVANQWRNSQHRAKVLLPHFTTVEEAKAFSNCSDERRMFTPQRQCIRRHNTIDDQNIHRLSTDVPAAVSTLPAAHDQEMLSPRPENSQGKESNTSFCSPRPCLPGYFKSFRNPSPPSVSLRFQDNIDTTSGIQSFAFLANASSSISSPRARCATPPPDTFRCVATTPVRRSPPPPFPHAQPQDPLYFRAANNFSNSGCKHKPTAALDTARYGCANAPMQGTLLRHVKVLIQRGRFPTGAQKWTLPLTNQKSRFVTFSMKRQADPSTPSLVPYDAADLRVDVFLLCFREERETTPVFEIPLTSAEVVTRTCTENGPCLYLSTATGVFEFQCTRQGRYNYEFWEAQMRYLGLRIISAHDLFSPVGCHLVGEGSFAKVYPATHRPSGTRVVIKTVPKDKLQHLPDNHQSAVQVEIDVLRRINHPFILNFQTAYEDESHYYIVLEQLAGGNVYEWLRNHRCYTESQARGAMFRVFTALAALESKGVVHRDLKLENLVLEYPTDPSSVKLIDFGLAAFLGSPRMNMQCGSPGFVAPEIILKKPYGTRVDMFSAGALLYSMLSGKTPFHREGDTTSQTLYNNKNCHIHFDSAIWKSISMEARDLVTRLLHRDPTLRYSPEQALMHNWMFGRVHRLPLKDSAVLHLLHPSYWKTPADLDHESCERPICDNSSIHGQPGAASARGSHTAEYIKNPWWSWAHIPNKVPESQSTSLLGLVSNTAQIFRSSMAVQCVERRETKDPSKSAFHTGLTRLCLLGRHVNPLALEIQRRNAYLYDVLTSAQKFVDALCEYSYESQLSKPPQEFRHNIVRPFQGTPSPSHIPVVAAPATCRDVSCGGADVNRPVVLSHRKVDSCVPSPLAMLNKNDTYFKPRNPLSGYSPKSPPVPPLGGVGSLPLSGWKYQPETGALGCSVVLKGYAELENTNCFSYGTRNDACAHAAATLVMPISPPVHEQFKSDTQAPCKILPISSRMDGGTLNKAPPAIRPYHERHSNLTFVDRTLRSVRAPQTNDSRPPCPLYKKYPEIQNMSSQNDS